MLIKNIGKGLLSFVIWLLVTALFCSFIVGIFDFSLFHKYFFPSTSFTTARYLFVLLVRLLTTVINMYLGLSERKLDHSFEDFYSTSASVFIGSSVISVLLYIAVGIKNESLDFHSDVGDIYAAMHKISFLIAVFLIAEIIIFSITVFQLFVNWTTTTTCLRRHVRNGTCTCKKCGKTRVNIG